MNTFIRKPRQKNIIVKGATVCYDDKHQGWVFPGRRFTKDHERAYRACCIMAAIIGGTA